MYHDHNNSESTRSGRINRKAFIEEPIMDTDINLSPSTVNNGFLDYDHIAKEIIPNIEVNSTLSDFSNVKSNKVCFKLKDQLLEYDILLSVKAYPNLFTNLNLQSKTLVLPNWIELKHLQDYFLYVEEIKNKNDKHFNYKKLTQIANFFENEVILKKIFENKLFPNINSDNCLSFLSDAYQYCSNDMASNEKIKELWFKLFMKGLEYMSKNFLHFLNNSSCEKLKKLNSKLIEEIIEKFLQNNFMNNIEISHQYELKLFKYLYEIRDLGKEENIYDLLINDYLLLSSNESVNELSTIFNPVFQLNLNNDFKYYYQEFIVPYHKHQLTFIVYYKNSEDIFNVSLKVNKNNEDLLSFMTVAFFNEDLDKKQINIKSVSSNKTSINIFKIHSFKKYIQEKNYRLNLKINLKFCFTHTFLSNHLNKTFYNHFDDNKISKISKNFLQTLLKNNKIRKDNDDQIVIALSNWCMINY